MNETERCWKCGCLLDPALLPLVTREDGAREHNGSEPICLERQVTMLKGKVKEIEAAMDKLKPLLLDTLEMQMTSGTIGDAIKNARDGLCIIAARKGTGE